MFVIYLKLFSACGVCICVSPSCVMWSFSYHNDLISCVFMPTIWWKD